MTGVNYVKIIGFKFYDSDVVNIVTDMNHKNIIDAVKFALRYDDNEMLWIVVPCNYIIKEWETDNSVSFSSIIFN